MLFKRIYAQSPPSKPLRYQLDHWLRPAVFFYLYLALLAGNILFELFFVATKGYGFMGIYQRPITLAMAVLVGGIALSLLTRRVPTAHQRPQPEQLFFVFLLIEFCLAGAMGMWLGRENANPHLLTYQRGLSIFLLLLAFVYVGSESDRIMARLTRLLAWFLGGVSLINALAIVVRLSLNSYRSPIASFDALYILPFASLYFLTQYLLTTRRPWLAFVLSVTASSGVVLRLEKPVLVPFIAAFIALWLLVLLLAPRTGVRRQKVLGRFLLLGLAAILALLLFELVVPGNILREYSLILFHRYLKYNSTLGRSIGRIDGGRFYIWQQGWKLFKASPIWGWGFGPGIRSDAGTVVFPHNLLVEFAVGVGLLGTIPLLLFFMSLPVYLFRSLCWQRYAVLKLALIGFLLYGLIFVLLGVLWDRLLLVNIMAFALGLIMRLATDDRQTIVTEEKTLHG